MCLEIEKAMIQNCPNRSDWWGLFFGGKNNPVGFSGMSASLVFVFWAVSGRLSLEKVFSVQYSVFFIRPKPAPAKALKPGACGRRPKLTELFIFYPQKAKPRPSKPHRGGTFVAWRDDDQSSSIGAAPCYFFGKNVVVFASGRRLRRRSVSGFRVFVSLEKRCRS
ncbi:MAG: hypothetical protein D6714_12745 [Bacteroidetes bacterium]|nr:MAG: hypothetical protein D6714_12745 [Bacteroidota bacterium]